MIRRATSETFQKNYKIIVLFAILIRFISSFLYGTQDVEWWKAWYKSIDEKGITNVYGKNDSTNINLLRHGMSFNDVRSLTQNHIIFKPHKYERNDYVVTQPPVYLYHLYVAGNVYKWFRPSLNNDRYYNFVLNLWPIFYSLLTAFLIFKFLSNSNYSSIATPTSLIFLINPLIILNSPIQGFWDPILGFYVIASLIALYLYKINISLFLYLIAILVKPTAIIIFPVYIYTIFRDFSLIKILNAAILCIFSAFVIVSPFVLTNHLISMVLGVHSILESSNDISRQALNFWWPFQYIANYWFIPNLSFWDFLSGNKFIWYGDFPISKINLIDLKVVSTLFYLVFTGINILKFSKSSKKNRINIFYFCFLQCYIYYMLRIGVQNNHYYIMIIMYSIFALMSKELFSDFFVILILFLFQDFLFYGFGRDFSYMISVFNYFNLPLITIIVSVINFLFFLKLVFKPVKF